MNAVGFVRVGTVGTLPLQHIVIFEKHNQALNPHLECWTDDWSPSITGLAVPSLHEQPS